jgi:hypothetical protein
VDYALATSPIELEDTIPQSVITVLFSIDKGKITTKQEVVRPLATTIDLGTLLSTATTAMMMSIDDSGDEPDDGREMILICRRRWESKNRSELFEPINWSD